MVDGGRIIREFIELAGIDSVTRKERRMADAVAGKLRSMGYEVHEDEAGDKIGGSAGNLICTAKGVKNVPAIMLAAHMDTVEPGIGKKPVIDGGFIRTDGSTVLGGDDAAGIVCILEALRVIKEKSLEHGDIQAVFTVAEEGGLLGSKNLDYGRIHARYGFVLDSDGPVGAVVVKAPSHNRISAVVTGRASHAGIEPEKGISAIQIAAAAIAGMKLGRIDGETTANIGVISGGRDTNVVCDRVEIKAEARSRDEEKLKRQTEHMKECFEKAAAGYGGGLEFAATPEYRAYCVREDSGIMEILRKAAGKTGIVLIPRESGGGSDTNIFNEKGIESVDVSVGMEKIHGTEERIAVDNLVKAAEFTLSIILNVS